jgi:hypothetical protein
METAVQAMASMETAPRALPHLGKVPEQRLLSPEIRRWRRQSCETFSGKLLIILGFSVGRLYIGGEAASGSGPGGLTPLVVRPGGRARHPLVWWPSGPPSDSPSVFVLRPGKIGVLAFVSSNSENISCVAFLKHKNSRKQGTGTVASRQ